MWPTQSNNNSNANSTSSEKNNLRTLGMTSAISVAEPKPIDITRTNELKEALKPYNVFESEEELNHRMEILRYILSIIYNHMHKMIRYP
jgi:poly(A) polymerase